MPSAKSPMNDRPCVTIEYGRLRAQEASIAASLEATVRPALSFDRTVFTAGGPTGINQSTEPFLLYRADHNGKLVFSRGLVPRVVTHLEQLGFQCQIDDPALWRQLTAADASLIDESDGSVEQRVFLDAVSRNPLGQIVCQRTSELVDHLALLVKFLSRSRIVIFVDDHRCARRVRHQLRRLTNRSIYLKKDIDWSDPLPVLVIPSNGFGNGNRDDWDVLVYLGSNLATGKEGHERSLWMCDQLRYCFDINKPVQHPHIQLRLEAVCGPVIYDCSKANDRLADVRTKFARSPSTTGADRRSGRRGDDRWSLERKRATIWHNEVRNDQIVDIAKALVRGNLKRLRVHGIELDTDEATLVVARRPRRVSVVVESVEHGRELQQRLPGWPLLCRNGTRSESNDISLVSGRSIVTEALVDEESDFDVLLRATGGPHPLAIDSFPRRVRDDRPDIQLLVDMFDRFDEQAAKDSRTRMRHYSEREWLTASAIETDVTLRASERRYSRNSCRPWSNNGR